MSEEFDKIETLAEQVRTYVNTRLSQAKLSTAEKASKLAATMIAILMAALVFFLFLLLLCVAAAILIGQAVGNVWLGFVIVAGLVLLLGLILWIAKDRLLSIPIMNAMIEALFDTEEEEK